MTNVSGSTNKIVAIVIVVVMVSAAAISVMLIDLPFEWDDRDELDPILPIDDAIRLNGDEELREYVSNHSLPGSGTSIDPYIIANLSIVENGNCIDIRNIEASFKIQDCKLKTTLEYSGIALYLSNCISVRVIRCRTEGGISGIELFQCDDAEVIGCLSKFSFFGINSSLSQRISIRESHVSNVTWGISLIGSNDTHLNDTQLFNNEYGVLSQFSFNCSVTYCNITDNIIGIKLELGCQHWMIHSNVLARNNEYNAIDDGESNLWDNDVDFGNWWDDFSGIGPYSVPGLAGSVDRYPQGL